MARGLQPLVGASTSPVQGVSQVPNNAQISINATAQRTGLLLPLEQMAVPIYTAREDVDEGGRVLFQNFVREEFEHEGIRNEPLMEAGDPMADIFNHNGINSSAMFGMPMYSNNQASSSVASTPEGYKHHNFISLGSTIRELADQFSRSRERNLLRTHANEVNLHDINKDLFWKFLHEIFKKGFTKQRLIALFFFCSDVLIRSARENLREVCANLFTWSLEYIVENVCKWVYENGGWEKVFGQIWNFAYRAAVFSALMVFIGVGFVYIRKNW